MKYLIVEDDEQLRKMLVKRLETSAAVEATGNGDEAATLLEKNIYDIVLMDIMVPGMDGITLLRKLRAESKDVQVIIITARDSITDRVRGLDAGADDYLIKPFAFEELQARIRALMRRKNNQPSNILREGDLYVDIATQKVIRGNRRIELTKKEYDLLVYMLYHAGFVLTRAQLEQNAWNDTFTKGSNIVDVYIRYLRQKIDQEGEQPLIHTYRGRGYSLEAR